MELDEILSRAAVLFPAAVRSAVANPGEVNVPFDQLRQLCKANFERLGYSCYADCYADIVPKHEGSLTLDAWSNADVEVSGWQISVLMRPFHLGAGYVHFEIRHKGPMPRFTETGYRSHFTPMATFSELTPMEFLEELIPKGPREQQMQLF